MDEPQETNAAQHTYSHIEVVVTLVVVNLWFLTFFITRHHEAGFGCKLVEMNPASLPDLSKLSRTLPKIPKIDTKTVRRT